MSLLPGMDCGSIHMCAALCDSWDIPHSHLFTSAITLPFTELLMFEEGVEINEG